MVNYGQSMGRPWLPSTKFEGYRINNLEIVVYAQGCLLVGGIREETIVRLRSHHLFARVHGIAAKALVREIPSAKTKAL